MVAPQMLTPANGVCTLSLPGPCRFDKHVAGRECWESGPKVARLRKVCRIVPMIAWLVEGSHGEEAVQGPGHRIVLRAVHL